MLIPHVIEKRNNNEYSYDLWSALLKDRIIFLGDEVNDFNANILVAQLLFLEREDPDADIQMYINSPGGSVDDGLAIYDVMEHISCDVATTCIGSCSSMGAILLASGTKGKRSALKNSRIMIHQVSAGARGTLKDMKIHTKQAEIAMENLMNILSEKTGKTLEQLYVDCDRDYYMSAEEALEYGLIDEIVKNKKKA